MTQPALPAGQPTQQQQPSHGTASGSMGLPQQQPQPGHATVQVKLPTGAVGVRGAQAAGRTDGAEVLGYWTDEEMGFLLAAISKVTGGSMNDNGLDWGAVAALVPSRSAKQCRQKYLNHLRPGISKDPWSLQEEYVLALMHSKIGNRWQELSRYLPSRPENTVKNHWSTTHRAKGYARIRTLLWVYCDLIVHQEQQPSVDVFAYACHIYTQLKGVTPIESFAVDENYFVSGPGSRRQSESDTQSVNEEPEPKVPVTVPQLAPPAHLKPSPLLDLANAWADKYHSGDAKEGEQVSAEESADSALQNPCRASWLAHVRSATRMQQQQQQVSSPDRRRVSARPTASAPAPAPAPPAAAPNSDASRGPVPPVSGVWQRVPAGVPLSAHHFVPSSYPLLHYQPKAMAPGPVLTVGVPMAAQAQALMVQQQQKQQQRSALVSSAAQAPGMHHKTYSALQQHHRLMASIHSQAGGPVHPGHRQVDGATAMLHAMHQHQSRQQQQLEESMQHRWRRPSHAEASGSMVSEGFAHPGLADVRAAVNSSPRALAGRWARYNVLPGQCSPLGGTLLCDEDLVASPTRRGAAGGDGSPAVRKGLQRHAGAAGSDDSDGSKHTEEAEGEAMQGGADRLQPPSHQEGSRAAPLERPAGPSATTAGDAARRGRLGDLAKGAHPLMRGFADGSDLKRSRQGAGAGGGQAVAPGEAPRVQARDGAAAAAATAAGAEEVGEEDPLRHADWGQQRKRQRSARQEAPEASGHFRAGRTGSGGVANAHSGVDMLLALADAANTILAGDDAGGCGSQADDEERCQAGADEEEEALRGPGCSPGAGSVDDATQVVIAVAEDSGEGHKHGTSQQHQRQDGASRRWPWSCKEGAAGAQQCAGASGKGTGQDTRSSSQLQTSSGASEPMAVGPLPAVDGEQVGGQGRAACFTEQPHRLSTTGDRGRQGEAGAAAMLGTQPSPRRSMDLGATVHAAMQVDGVVVAVATAPSALAGSRGEAAAAQGHCSVGTGARLSSAPCDVTADGSVDVAIRFKGGDGDGCSRLGSAPAAAKTAALSQDGVPAGAGAGSQPWLQTLSQLATDASCTAQERLDLMKAYMAMVQQGLTTQIE